MHVRVSPLDFQTISQTNQTLKKLFETNSNAERDKKKRRILSSKSKSK